MFSDTPEDKVAECKTEKSKHFQQRKNFGTAGKEIEKNFLTCIVALNDRKKILGISYGLHCQCRRKVLILFDTIMVVNHKLIGDSWKTMRKLKIIARKITRDERHDNL